MQGRRINHSAMSKGKLGNIPAYSVVNISGMGGAEIGDIGEGSVINHSSMGNVRIRGKVSTGVRITHSGMGNLVFDKMPPNDVINNTTCTSMGSVKYPDGTKYSSSASGDYNVGTVVTVGDMDVGLGDMFSGFNNCVIGVQSNNGSTYTSVTSTGNKIVRTNDKGLIEVIEDGVIRTYKGNRASIINDAVVIDGYAVSKNDDRLVDTQPYETKKKKKKGGDTYTAKNVGVMGTGATFVGNMSVSGSSATMFAPPAPVEPVAPVVASPDDKLSVQVNIYAAKLKAKPSHAELLASKNMRVEDQAAFAQGLGDLFDKETGQILNVPVTVNGRFYELNSLLFRPVDADGKRRTADGKEFRLSDVKPADFLVDAIQAALSMEETPKVDAPRLK